jgi:hypothetical protein
MKLTNLTYILIGATIFSLVMFWLTRYSVFNNEVSLHYEDWARGALALDEEAMTPATRFWQTCSIIGVSAVAALGIYHLVSRFDRL